MEPQTFITLDSPVYPPITEYHLDNIFTTCKLDEKYFFNLAKKIEFPDNITSDSYIELYYKPSKPLTALSNEIYGSQHLWWMILYMNKIYNPFSIPKEGMIIRVPTPDTVRIVLDSIRESIVNK